jgi:hypothetical protein
VFALPDTGSNVDRSMEKSPFRSVTTHGSQRRSSSAGLLFSISSRPPGRSTR